MQHNVFLPVFSAIKADNVHMIMDAAIDLVEFFLDFNIASYAEEVQNTIDISSKRYGKGAALLAPSGFYNPTGILDTIADNISRGSLFKKRPAVKCLYEYEYDHSSTIRKIICIPNSTITLCESASGITSFLTYQTKNGLSTINNIACALHDENGHLISMFSILLRSSDRYIFSINAEYYQHKDEKCQFVKWYDITGDKRDCPFAGNTVVQSELCIRRDEKNKITDWNWVSRKVEQLNTIT